MPKVPTDAEIRMRLEGGWQQRLEREKLERKERDQRWLQEITMKAEKDDKERMKREEERLLQQKKKLKGREKRQREIEEKRVQETLSHAGEWGDEMCQWVVEHKIEPNRETTIEIMSKLPQWGKDICKPLLEQKINIGMTVEMVTLALGVPTIVDEKVVTAKGEKFRWVYGIPRQGAIYIWFKNGTVTKIKQ